ncbi:thiolase family protein [Phreatobacter stygius]|uniref:Thiolase family protein n=1 Tax=Phreatobacter stygius TaxID=1940610 RepID=A0A4D7B9V4_9HYPH|nr:thiolase family protein [Phreatobacter stygius]QCI67370.1 thiolase family protein [Phreatobacter stygius]
MSIHTPIAAPALNAPWPLRDKIAFAGIGTTAYGNFPDTDSYGLGCEALNGALDDAGLKPSDIDGLIVNRIPSYERFAEIMGIDPQYCLMTEAPGRFASVSLALAAQAIATGAAKHVALVYGNNGRSVRMQYGGGDSQWAPWGMTSPGAIHAMMWRRHMHQFGTTHADLGAVSTAFRHHACLNPDAVMHGRPMTTADHAEARPICEPLKLLDYCLINDGAVAWIVTSAERARDLKRPPVLLSGYTRQDAFHYGSSPADDFWYGNLSACRSVYDRAGIGRDDLSGLGIYDNFSPTVLFSLEGLGFCAQGEGGEFVKDGTLQLGRGRWPTNTSGGHLSDSYMQGWGIIAECVRQLRHDCDARQIPDAQALQYICATNIAQSLILRRAA